MRFQSLQRRLLDGLMTLKGAVSLFANPANTTSVYDIEDGLRREKSTQLSIEFIKSQPGMMALVNARYLSSAPDLEALLQYPEGSLGFTYATYLKEHGFDAKFYRSLEVDDDTSYIFLRRRQTHDIWHIMTGFDVDEASEVGLKAFELAQTRSTMAAILLTGSLLRTLQKKPEELGYLLDRIAVGYRMGAKANPFLAQQWEEAWDKSVDQWRKELNVQVATHYIP